MQEFLAEPGRNSNPATPQTGSGQEAPAQQSKLADKDEIQSKGQATSYSAWLLFRREGGRLSTTLHKSEVV